MKTWNLIEQDAVNNMEKSIKELYGQLCELSSNIDTAISALDDISKALDKMKEGDFNDVSD